MSCKKECTHERHQKYLGAFTNLVSQFEYLINVTHFVTDANLSPNNPDDIDLFQDLLFEGRHGRIHIVYYETLFNCPLISSMSIGKTTKVFARYLDYLDKVSSLFTADALHFVFKK